MSGMYGNDPPRGGGGYVGGNRGGGGGYRGGGYQGGDRGSGRGGDGGGRGGGRGGGSGREGDWSCSSCGNLNFARRTECNKCGAANSAGGGGDGYNRGGSGGGYNRDESGGGGYHRGGRTGGYGGGGNNGGRTGSYGGNHGRNDSNYAQIPPPGPPSYGGSGGNYPAPPNSYGGNNNYRAEPAPVNSYGGGPNSYPPSYGAPSPTGYGSDAGRGVLPSGYDGGHGDPRSGPPRDIGGPPRHPSGGYGSAPVEAPVKVKQCDENCSDTCDNARIYISNLPPDVTTDELKELFGGIGQVGRVKQKRGYKDQWPWNIKIYTDDSGKSKGDAVLSYEDPSAAHSAGGFYNNYDMRGYRINVAMAEKSAPRAPPVYGHGGGRGGDRRRDNYRDGGSGPDRHRYGGQRSAPY